MKKKIVVFVVGHERWGKSHTLRALRRICNHKGRRVTISGVKFFVRMMSNDDQPNEYREFVQSTSEPYIIAALCPKFKKLENDKNADKLADETLRSLLKRRRGYVIFFWVIKHKWGGSAECICKHEITEMSKYGKVKVFTRIGAPSNERARKLRRFISNVVIG